MRLSRAIGVTADDLLRADSALPQDGERFPLLDTRGRHHSLIPSTIAWVRVAMMPPFFAAAGRASLGAARLHAQN